MASEDLRKEIATIGKDPWVITFGGVLRNQDDTLLTRGGGKGLKIYDEIERDCHAFAVLQKRKLAVIAREWQVVPASDSTLDKQAADLVKRQLGNLKFDQVCLKLLDATLKGYSVGEVIWETDGSEIVASRVKVKPQRRFVFDENQEPRLLTQADLITGEPLPPRKFIVHRYGEKDDDNPYGLGLGHKLFWPVLFKRQDITFWLTFVDKFASPTAVGEYPAGTSDADQKKLLAALSSIASEAGIAIPQGMLVRFLEAARSGSIDTYERLARYMDEQISECVLGETLSTNVGTVGSKAASQTHNEVRTELSKADGDLLSDTLNETLVRWIVELNLPGAGLPKVWRDFTEADDLKLRSERDKNLTEMGFEPDEQYISDTYGGKWVKKQAASPSLSPVAAAQFAEPGRPGFTSDQQAIEGLADAALVEADLSGNEAKLLAAIQGATSYEDAMEKLLALWPELTMDDMAAALEPALLSAGLFGQYRAGKDTGND
jgi:phage gp29-like protein